MMENIYVASPTVALLTSVLLQVLKNTKIFPWIDRDTGKLNALISGLVAFISSLGIAMSFDWEPESGRFAAGFTGNIWDILHVLWHFPVQWAQQHAFYKGLLVPAEVLGEIRAILKEGLLAERPQVKPEVPPTE